MSPPADTLALIDTHIHFDDDRFDADRHHVYRDAAQAGICAMVVPATTQSRWAKIQAISGQYHNVYATHGLHPLFCNQHEVHHLQLLQQQAEKGVAVGECGLDKQKDTVNLKTQQHYFDAQLQIAKDTALPLIIHARNTVEEVILMLKQTHPDRPSGNGVIHSFSGSQEQAHRLIDLNFKMSFGGPLTSPNAHKLRRLIAKLPLDSIMLETDAPDQSGRLHRGRRNEPQWLPEVLSVVCELRSESAEAIAATCNRNAITLFQLPADTGLNAASPAT